MIEKQESITAKLCLFARAYHSGADSQSPKIFDDYLSFDLMGRSEYEEIGQLIENDFDSEKYDENRWFRYSNIKDVLYKYILPIPLSRLSFAEHALADFAEAHDGKIQYVICGAGMDSFAFRNINKNIRIFEIDHPDTQAYKKQRIKELEWTVPQNLTFVPVDFSKDNLKDRLLQSGFDTTLPTFTAILGVSYYLTLPVFEETLRIISELTSEGSRVIFDFPDDSTFSERQSELNPRVKELAEVTKRLGEPMLHGFSVEEIKDALERHSMFVDRHEGPEEIQKKYFSNRKDDLKAYENVHFIVAEKTV